MPNKFYKLDESQNIIPVNTINDVADMFDDFKKRKVGHTCIGDIEISTVFLCIDHNYTNNGPPVLFETMVFGGEFDGECRRYSSWDEALSGHEKWVKKLGGEIKEKKSEKFNRFDIIDID